MNILKEMGIQQWQRRSARPAVDVSGDSVEQVVDSSAVSHGFEQERPINTDLRAALSVERDVSLNESSNEVQVDHSTAALDAPFSNETDNAVTGGFSGSLRQALDQSISKKNASISNAEIKSTSDSSNKQKTELSKDATPINLSALLLPEVESISDEVFHVASELSIDHSPVEVELEILGSEFDSDTHSLLEDLAPVGRDLSKIDWPSLQKMIETNEHCPSCGWGNCHLGSGNQSADWMFIVDAPNTREVQAQALLSGRAGQLFDAMLNVLNLNRDNIYCTSIFKCAPTDDLSMTPQCDELLHRQIQLVSPQVVITFGEFAAQSVIKSNSPLATLRTENQHSFRSQISVIPTYSPAEMLENVGLKAQVWTDLKQALRLTSA